MKVSDGPVVPWRAFSEAVPELAAFGAARLRDAPAYLATVRASGVPRVHPVTPIVSETSLYLFMEPTSPKGRDICERGVYALHTKVPDMAGTGGEFRISGRGLPIRDPAARDAAIAAAPYVPAERYVLFELLIADAFAHGYGDVELPAPPRWSVARHGT
jgi:hypothetical protein